MPRPAESPLVGRDAEVAALAEALGAAARGERGCVLVTGEAGIGKSRLVAEVTGGRDDVLVLTGHAADVATGEIPFGVLADTLRDLLRRRGPDALTAAERASLAPLLPGEQGADGVQPVRLISGALDLLSRLAAEERLVWVVEDLHWADTATRDLLNLAVRSGPGGLLCVVTVRTDDPERPAAVDGALVRFVAELARLPHTVRLDLPRLSVTDVGRQLSALRTGLSPEDARRIAQLSDGVPFAVEELAAAHDRPGASGAGSVLAGRIESLGPDARRLVAAAAVGDGHLQLTLVEQVLDATPEELDDLLSEAVAAGVLTYDAAGDRLGFRHALLRDAADRATGPGARRAWHRRWAEVLEDNPGALATDPGRLVIAEHWHHTRDAARSVAAAYAAVPASMRTGGPDDQLALWRRVVDGWAARAPGSAVGALTLRDVVGEAMRRPGAGTGAQATEDFLAAVRRLDPEPAVRAVLDLAGTLWLRAKGGRIDQDRIGEVADACDWLVEPADALTETALALVGGFLPPDDERAGAHLARAAALAERSGDHDRTVTLAIIEAFRVQMLQGPAAAVELMEARLGDVGRADPEQYLTFVGNLAYCHLLLGRHDRADALLTEQLDGPVRLEALPGQWEHLAENAVATWSCSGQWRRARELVERGSPWWSDDLRLSHLFLARLDLLQEGATDEERWRQGLGQAIRNGPTEADLRRLLGHAAGARGDLAAMRELTGPSWEDRDVLSLEAAWRSLVDLARVEADAAVDDPDRADRTEAAAHLALLAGVGAECRLDGDLGPAWAADLSAQADRFHGRDARTSLAAAHAGWAAVGHEHDLAVTALALAEAHPANGDRDLARKHLADGVRRGEALGARPLLERAAAVAARHALDAAGAARPRSVEALTDREAEVLALLAEGRTNREIAEALFMSPKTASVHVSRIFAKLGASNRTEAAAIARRHDPGRPR